MAALAYCWLILLPACENRMDRKIAVPSVPPTERKNVEEAEATPMSLAGTAFCMASTRLCMFRPSPMPKTAMKMSVLPQRRVGAAG